MISYFLLNIPHFQIQKLLRYWNLLIVSDESNMENSPQDFLIKSSVENVHLNCIYFLLFFMGLLLKSH